MEEKLVSIIVPIYNSEDSLKIMLESLLRQTYRNIEIILVNDGSEDHSGEICEFYKSKNSQIKYIHIKNSGVAKARNLGIKYAKGEYIAFVDADDVIDEDYIKILMYYLQKYNLDTAICGYRKIYSYEDITKERKRKRKLAEKKIRIMAGDEALELMLYRKILTSGPCAKIVKKSIVVSGLFPEGKLYEDLGAVYKWYGRAEKVGYISYEGYYYLQRKGSYQHSKYNIKKWDLIEISNEIVNYVSDNKKELIKAAHNRIFISAIQIFRLIPFGVSKNQVEELKEIIKLYRKEMLYNKNAKNSSRLLALISYINIDSIRIMGKVYDFLLEKLKIRMNY